MATTAVQWELWGRNFSANIANLWVSCYNGNNDWSALVLFVQHPREQVEWLRQNPSVAKPSLRSGFDCTIRPVPSGAGRTTPSQPGYYPLTRKSAAKGATIPCKEPCSRFIYFLVQIKIYSAESAGSQANRLYQMRFHWFALAKNPEVVSPILHWEWSLQILPVMFIQFPEYTTSFQTKIINNNQPSVCWWWLIYSLQPMINDNHRHVRHVHTIQTYIRDGVLRLWITSKLSAILLKYNDVHTCKRQTPKSITLIG